MPARNKGFHVPLYDARYSYAEKHGVTIGSEQDDGSFWAPGITINGKPTADHWGHNKLGESWQGIRTVQSRTDAQARKLWKGISEEIPGLRCPYCHALCFKTDHPNIAVCGAAPGWFCFYERIEKKKAMKIINGEMVEVTEEEHG